MTVLTQQQLQDAQGLIETTESTASVYKGSFLDAHKDHVRLPNGMMATREYLKHPGAVMVIPVFDNGDVLIERQYRYPLHQVFIEFPAGKKDEGESPLETGQRELLEETGYCAAEWLHVTDIHNAIAYSDEVIHFYIAKGLVKQHDGTLDDNEFLQVLRVPLTELESWMRQGWVSDVKTQLGIFWLKDYLAQQTNP
ncbi:NUDIX domain-containing protein [Hydromonas duriensis]|uniref:GDP-mannose pyrophosphatase n=1 Tax=Hydromonas duriensis TaxID=1527608 RepID=A0A4R6Y928_9BURK|nr:NUDIX hydrolase [Hydromonas duriensis]TDR31942.1 ADP-ribose pyrophosphatase [Hydromonas duriensis]